MKLTTCSFAHAGTYGHECGKHATIVLLIKSDLTKSGVYFARRCDSCARYRGGDNTGTYAREKFNPSKHINEWK